jgi:hypothetical protein
MQIPDNDAKAVFAWRTARGREGHRLFRIVLKTGERIDNAVIGGYKLQDPAGFLIPKVGTVLLRDIREIDVAD